MGLVEFDGTATVLVPPTTDRQALDRGIDNLQLGERTAIGEGIFASLQAIKQVPAQDGTEVPARIVLMTDGTTTDGRTNDQAVAAAKAVKVPVSTIAYGTSPGTITRREPAPGATETDGGAVDKSALAAIAHGTGGQAFSAATEGQLKQIYKNIGTSIGFTTERLRRDRPLVRGPGPGLRVRAAPP